MPPIASTQAGWAGTSTATSGHTADSENWPTPVSRVSGIGQAPSTFNRGTEVEDEIEAPVDDLEASEDVEDDASLGDASVRPTRVEVPGEGIARGTGC